MKVEQLQIATLNFPDDTAMSSTFINDPDLKCVSLGTTTAVYQKTTGVKYYNSDMVAKDMLLKGPEYPDRESPIKMWTPIRTRPLTDEEKEYYSDYSEDIEFIYDCILPEDDEEVLITTKNGDVAMTIFYRTSSCDCYFEYYEDEGDVIAWMPKPIGYKEI